MAVLQTLARWILGRLARPRHEHLTFDRQQFCCSVSLARIL
jgi:hypothetical protein